MTQTFTDFDPAEFLETPEAIAEFLNEALAVADAAYIAKALGVVARAKGMSQIAEQTGLSREQLYKTFSEQGNPTLKTLSSSHAHSETQSWTQAVRARSSPRRPAPSRL